jgi:RimJ/RimL family protein N-acetyltransferase
MAIPGVQLYQPALAERTVVLADGARAVVRPLASGEAAVVQEVFDGLSDASRRQRFAGAKPALSPRDLELLSAVDHENHEAFVALEPGTGRAVGEARVVRDRKDPGVGEVAFAVTDAWQGRRLGTHLADILVRRARELGFRRLRASMLADNARSHALMRRMGIVVARRYGRGELELEVALD